MEILENQILENLSRKARKDLFLEVVRKMSIQIENERKDKKEKGVKMGRGRAPILRTVAEMLGVSLPTVKAWNRGAWQSSNKNADTLLRKAFDLSPGETCKILNDDYNRYGEAVKQYGDESNQKLEVAE